MIERKVIFSFMVFVLIGILILGAKAALGQPIEVRVANFQPSLMKSNEMLLNWGKLVEKETGGKVRFILFPGATLAKAADTYDSTISGVSDMSWSYAGYSMGRFPLSEIIVQPFGFRNSEQSGRVICDLYEKFPEIRAEYKDTHLLWLSPGSPRHIISRVPVRRVGDLKGLKVRVPPSEAAHVRALGGVAVPISGPDVYTALERGTIDGTLHPWDAVIGYKWYEIARYYTKADLYLSGLFICAMNLNTWNKLPADVQNVINKYSGRYGTIEAAAKGYWDHYDNNHLEWLKKNTPNEFIDWSNEEKAKAQSLMKAVLDQWVADVEKRGLPGRKILDECIRLKGVYHIY